MAQLALEQREEQAALQTSGQRLLFSPEIEVLREKEEAEGRYTLERFRERRPDAYQQCVEELAASKPGYEGLRRIAGIVGVHWLTVAGVRDEATDAIDTLRNRLSRKALTAAELLMDRVLENPDGVPLATIGMTMDQLTRIGELMGNRATSRSEHTEHVDIHGNWEDVKRRLLPSERQLSGDEVREIEAAPAGTGLEGGKIPAVEGRPPCGAQVKCDVGSEFYLANPRNDTTNDTACDALCSGDEASEAAKQPGGGGGSRIDGVGSNQIGSNDQKFFDKCHPSANP